MGNKTSRKRLKAKRKPWKVSIGIAENNSINAYSTGYEANSEQEARECAQPHIDAFTRNPSGNAMTVTLTSPSGRIETIFNQ